MKIFFIKMIGGLLLIWPLLGLAQPTILVLGDSLSAGYGMPVQQSWPSLLQQDIPRYRIVNASISGETTTGGKQRLPKLMAQHQPTIVLLELGANDALRGMPIAEIERNLAQMIALAQQQRARVLLLGMRIPPNYGPAYTQQFEQLYHKLAAQYRVALLPFLLEGVLQFQADNLHPLAVEQPGIKQRVWQKLQPLTAQ